MIKIDISWQDYSIAANMEKFATQLERDVLIALKEYASREGKQVQSVVNMALREFLESQGSKTRYWCLPEKYPTVWCSI